MKKKGEFNTNRGLLALTGAFLIATALPACSSTQTISPQPGHDIRSNGLTEVTLRQGEGQLSEENP
ncbi:MAG: hypothetical protein D3910_24780, partial [Candidatus Electrothrix sp. ATG2]|nr:hypothetical protein [Candidatus Electrothrix sp. ATG2]